MCRTHDCLIVNAANRSLQIIAIKLLLWITSLIADLDHATWDDKILELLDFVPKFVLQVPFLLMTLMRYITPTLDDM